MELRLALVLVETEGMPGMSFGRCRRLGSRAATSRVLGPSFVGAVEALLESLELCLRGADFRVQGMAYLDLELQ